ncbi:zinc finger, CCHC-type containing protein [Tanacetum coccineum]
MKEDESINSFAGKLMSIITKAATYGLTFDEQTKVRKVLNAVPDKFLPVVATIEMIVDFKTVKLEEIIGKLKTYEERIKFRKASQEDNSEKLLLTRQRNNRNYKHNYRNGRRGGGNQTRGRWKDRDEGHTSFRSNSYVCCDSMVGKAPKQPSIPIIQIKAKRKSSNKVGGPYNYRWLSSNSLKRLFLKGVTVGDEALQSSCLTYSPHLETLSLHYVGYYNNYFNVHVSGRDLLSLDIGLPQENFKRNSIPFLPNIKNLRLTFDVKNDDSLLEFTNLAKACPTLETFTVKLPWTWSMPLNRRRKVRHAANHPHNHLKFLELLGYYCGQMSELELAVYFIYNAFGLTRNLIDPRKQSQHGTTFSEFSNKELS